VLLTANQAIRVAAPDAPGKPAKPIERIAADEKRFYRAMPGPVPFPLFSTGVGLDRGALDPNWEVAAISSDPAWKPTHAAVVPWDTGNAPYYAPDSREAGQWVCSLPEDPKLPPLCRMTFRTQFDLSGFEPTTAAIEGQFAVDNRVVELHVNGKTIPVADQGGIPSMCAIRIDQGFVTGRNTIELVVENDYYNGVASRMGLCVQWKGTARRVIKAKAEN
jgi:hypothetical protein